MKSFDPSIKRAPAFALAALLALGTSSAFAEQAAAPAPDAAAAQPVDVAPVERAAPAAEAPEAVEVPAEAPATAEAPAPAQAAAATAVSANDVKIGTPVFAAEGEKIGEVNRVTSAPTGEVSEIQVTFGTPAGLNAKAFAVPVDKIVGLQDGVKLSLSADQAKSQPAVEGGSG